MKNTKKIFIILFFIVLALDIYSVIIDNKSLEVVFKPLLTTVLAVWYVISIKKPNFLYLSALFFSFWGDVLLLFKEKYFVVGLLSFLVAHIFYIKLTTTFYTKTSLKKYIKAFIPFALFFSIIIFLIKDNLGEMLLPIVVYGFVISVFGTVTLINYWRNKTYPSKLLLLGAIIFIISDSFIALNKFYAANEIYGVLIMLTYGFAQFLICKSTINKELNTQN